MPKFELSGFFSLFCTLSLFMSGIFANYINHASSANAFTLHTSFFHRGLDFHIKKYQSSSATFLWLIVKIDAGRYQSLIYLSYTVPDWYIYFLYYILNAILPLLRSYGVISIFTLSPKLNLILFFLIRPERWAMIAWPFSSLTRKVAAGNNSSITPSISITSFLDMFVII